MWLFTDGEIEAGEKRVHPRLFAALFAQNPGSQGQAPCSTFRL